MSWIVCEPLAAIGVVGQAISVLRHFRRSWHPFITTASSSSTSFCVLSGFVLARAYWNDQRSATFANNVRERIARMYPLHFATLCAVGVMQWILVNRLSSPPFVYVFNDTYDFVLNLLC